MATTIPSKDHESQYVSVCCKAVVNVSRYVWHGNGTKTLTARCDKCGMGDCEMELTTPKS